MTSRLSPRGNTNASLKTVPATEPFGTPAPDGSLVITPEQMARFGAGDPKRGMRELQLILAAEKDQTIRSGPTEKPTTVRIATIKDEAAIHALLMQDLRENAERVAPINPEKVARHIFACTRKKGDGVIGVIDGKDGAPVAVVILHRLEWWWSNASYWQEIPLYVHPDHRNSKHADDLTKFARWWTDNFNGNLGYRMYLFCGVLGLHRLREKTIFYRRRFVQVGTGFLYPPPEMGDAP